VADGDECGGAAGVLHPLHELTPISPLENSRKLSRQLDTRLIKQNPPLFRSLCCRYTRHVRTAVGKGALPTTKCPEYSQLTPPGIKAQRNRCRVAHDRAGTRL
jgi:hypothetical protein